MDQWLNNLCGLSRDDLWLFDHPNQCDGWSDVDVSVRRCQDHIQRQDHAFLIIQKRKGLRGTILERKVMRVGMCVGDHVLVAVEPSRPMDVLHRRQRQYADCETEQDRQKTMTHYAECYAMRLSSATED